jgi:ABC-2 type transport system ATP-binding protein
VTAATRLVDDLADPPRIQWGRGNSLRAQPVEEIVVVEQLTKRYEPTPQWMRPFVRTHIRQPVQALDGLDLVVRAGEICAIVGPNGAGKTTLFRTIVGLTTPTSGRATVLGLDVEHQSEQVRQVTGWMPAEDRSLLMRATSKENLHLHGRLQGMTPRELAVRIPETLGVVGLTAQIDSIVASMSAGMKARLRLARALLTRPRVLLLDEPTGAIDPIAAHSLLELITKLAKRERLAVLLSSHRLEEIEALQSNALLLDQGCVKYAGDLDQLRERCEEPELTLGFVTTSAASRATARLLTRGLDAQVDGLVVTCRLAGRSELGEVLCALGAEGRRAVRRVEEVPMPLRDLIARVYSVGMLSGQKSSR